MKNVIYVKPHDEESYIWEQQERKNTFLYQQTKKDLYENLLKGNFVHSDLYIENYDNNFFEFQKTEGNSQIRLFTKEEYIHSTITSQMRYDYWLDYNDEQSNFKTFEEFMGCYYDDYLENEKEYLSENYDTYLSELKEFIRSWEFNYYYIAKGLYETQYIVIPYTAKERIKMFWNKLIRRMK